MKKKLLGKTGLSVSEICYGSLTLGPLQANLPLENGAEILRYAFERGVNFVDTAQLYETYPYIRRAMEISQIWDIVISSKTYAYTREMAKEAVEQARCALGRDYIDIFMLHEQESCHTLRGHGEALEYLYECKQKGIVKAVGASMHHIAAVHGAIDLQLDVIHPLINVQGLGIVDGTREQMEEALKKAHANQIGIFSMKPLGGGNLHKNASKCLEYVRGCRFIDSIAIGMQSVTEIEANLAYFQTGEFPPKALEILQNTNRKLHIDEWCVGCGKCVERCGQKAMVVKDGLAHCDHTRCILCSYCAAVCPEWAIKVL